MTLRGEYSVHRDGAHSREGALTNSITVISRFARNGRLLANVILSDRRKRRISFMASGARQVKERDASLRSA